MYILYIVKVYWYETHFLLRVENYIIPLGVYLLPVYINIKELYPQTKINDKHSLRTILCKKLTNLRWSFFI